MLERIQDSSSVPGFFPSEGYKRILKGCLTSVNGLIPFYEMISIPCFLQTYNCCFHFGPAAQEALLMAHSLSKHHLIKLQFDLPNDKRCLYALNRMSGATDETRNYYNPSIPEARVFLSPALMILMQTYIDCPTRAELAAAAMSDLVTRGHGGGHGGGGGGSHGSGRCQAQKGCPDTIRIPFIAKVAAVQ